MNDIIKGADIHAGDGEYSIGTQEEYEEFVKAREEHAMLRKRQALGKSRIKELALQAGLGDHLWLDIPDSEDVQVTEKFAELIVAECLDIVGDCSVEYTTRPQIIEEIKEHFGVK